MKNLNFKEINFDKYKNKGAYHWNQISKSLIKRNSFVVARYENILNLYKYSRKPEKIKILDAGCGDGVLTYLIRKKGFKSFGLDISEEGIHFAKKIINDEKINFSVGSLYNMPYEDNTFDVIFSSEVIEHLKHPELFLKEAKRILKNRGQLILSTPIKYTKHPLDKMHVQEWFVEDYSLFINKYFPNSSFYYSHSLYWKELNERRLFLKIILNFFSLLGKNVFKGFDLKWKLFALQYSVSIVTK